VVLWYDVLPRLRLAWIRQVRLHHPAGAGPRCRSFMAPQGTPRVLERHLAMSPARLGLSGQSAPPCRGDAKPLGTDEMLCVAMMKVAQCM